MNSSLINNILFINSLISFINSVKWLCRAFMIGHSHSHRVIAVSSIIFSKKKDQYGCNNFIKILPMPTGEKKISHSIALQKIFLSLNQMKMIFYFNIKIRD